MLTVQLTYPLSDKLLVSLERAPQLSQRSYGDEQETFFRLYELHLRSLTYTVLFPYPDRNGNHTLTSHGRNLTQQRHHTNGYSTIQLNPLYGLTTTHHSLLLNATTVATLPI